VRSQVAVGVIAIALRDQQSIAAVITENSIQVTGSAEPGTLPRDG
jgi:hypothetical protein